jgi:hypothetical protein
MSDTNYDVEFSGKYAGAGFTQLKPPRDGGSITVSVLGKNRKAGYHWLPNKSKGYRCNNDDDGNGACPACAAGLTRSWSCVALAVQYTSPTSLQVGYLALSIKAFRELSTILEKNIDRNITLTNVGSGFSFETRPGVAAWRANDQMQRDVEQALASEFIEQLLMSKLYEPLTNEEWTRVLAGKRPQIIEEEEI